MCSPSPCDDPGKTWTILTPRHGLSLCIQHARSDHLQPRRNIETVRHAPSCLPHHTTCLSHSLRVVEDRAQSGTGPTSTFLPLWHLSPALHANLWRGHFTDLPSFANVQFHCNNETCMSICPSSYPVAPLEKSVSSQHTVSHRRTLSTWSFGEDTF